MFILPEKYGKSIISMFGIIGEEWLLDVNNIVNKYVDKFNLTNISIHENLSINLILYAKCEEFGDVVLKMGPPIFDELIIREVVALEAFNGNGACKCFYNNIEDGVRILERLVLGEELHNIEDREERIKEFCSVALKLNVKMTEHKQLPTYREILNRTISQFNEQPEKYQSLGEYINLANELYKEIENCNLPKYLLHADLQHSNILTSGNSRKAIDPHGFLGEKVLETARFMEEEIIKQESTKKNILEVLDFMSKYFGEDRDLLCKVLFIDYVLSTCWDIEMNLQDNHISEDINNLNLVVDYLQNISILDNGKKLVF